MAYGDVPLEITVLAPKEFKPAKDASVYDHRAEGGAYETKLNAVNVYFDVEIKNVSRSDKYESDFIFSDVSGTPDDDTVSTVSDDNHRGIDTRLIKPGHTFKTKDAFSVTGADQIVYEISFDGLAGRTFEFRH